MNTEYIVVIGLVVRDEDTGKDIDFHVEREYYDTYAEALSRAEYLKAQLGEEFCHWGTDIGILDGVDVQSE